MSIKFRKFEDRGEGWVRTYDLNTGEVPYASPDAETLAARAAEPSDQEAFAAYQKLQKEQLNDRLNHNQNGQSIGQDVSSNATELKEKNFAKNATLLGDGPGNTHAGIESLESKVDNAGSTSMGDAMCSLW